MKFNGKWITNDYKNKTLAKSFEIYNKLITDDQIDVMAYKIAKNSIGGRRNNKIPQTILGLMHPIIFKDDAKNLFDVYGNLIKPIEVLSKLNTLWMESEDPFKESEPNKVYYFSNIQIRKHLSTQVDFLLNWDAYTRGDKILYALVKTMMECAFNTKSSYIPYNTTFQEDNGTSTPGIGKRRYFRLDFFLKMRNKTIAELMNTPIKEVTLNTTCNEYLYDESISNEKNQEKAVIVSKIMCKNILQEIPIEDILNLFIIDEGRIFKWDLELSNLINYDFSLI